MSIPVTPVAMDIGDLGGGDVAAPLPRALARMTLSSRQKAAVIVRLLLAEGIDLPIAQLSDDVQESLTAELGRLRFIDRDTLRAVVEEFTGELDSIGLSFPGGIEGALGILEDHLSPATAARMRRKAGVMAKGDPWKRISGLDPELLVQVLNDEAPEVGAVMLSKLEVSKAAALLEKVPGERARRISYAISQTAVIGPEVVQRIGLSLAQQLDAQPVKAFDAEPVDRVGAILNSSPAATRDDVIAGLEETDAAFAEEVKKAIFTFANIPARLSARDVPKAIRGIDQAVLVTALAYANGRYQAAREFVLENMSKRMAEGLREEIAETGKVKSKDGEEAMSEVIKTIRRLEANGEILLVTGDEDDE